MNKIFLYGRLTADPERLTTKGGDPYVRMRVADNAVRNGEEIAQFHNVTAFGKTAQLVAEYLTKGRECIVDGRLQVREAMDKNGNPRTYYDILASSVQFVGSKGGGRDDWGGQQQTRQQQNTRLQPSGNWGGSQQRQAAGNWGNAPQQPQQNTQTNNDPIPF